MFHIDESEYDISMLALLYAIIAVTASMPIVDLITTNPFGIIVPIILAIGILSSGYNNKDTKDGAK